MIRSIKVPASELAQSTAPKIRPTSLVPAADGLGGAFESI